MSTRATTTSRPTSYDSKWGIDFGEVGQGQVVGKLRKVLGPAALDRGFDRSLEVGAGTGYFSLNLLRAGIVRDATCTDISPGMVRALSANAERLGLAVKGLRADAESLPFADESFDLVLGHAVLHHLPDLDARVRGVPPRAEAGRPDRVRRRALARRRPDRGDPQARRVQARAGVAPRARGRGPTSAERPEPGSQNGAADHGLEQVVDIHAFAPDDLVRLARGAGFDDVRVRGEELLANWFGWFNRGLEATADPADVPMLWRQYAFRGYLLLQRVDERLLEPVLPPAIFYNLLVAARRP